MGIRVQGLWALGFRVLALGVLNTFRFEGLWFRGSGIQGTGRLGFRGLRCRDVGFALFCSNSSSLHRLMCLHAPKDIAS